ncbi:MAG TPA: MOSC N-terminal beta barrel domain-containing protein [Hanamia sp.]|nr:MOSC N-terminal beta barrel domain-containing protein [Hanamia sp.]
MLSVSHLLIYPIKSLHGIAIQSASLTDRGLEHDRRFLLIDKNNRFLTQREFPKMALLQTAIEEDNLFVFQKDSFKNKLVLPLAPEPSNEKIVVRIWDDDCEAMLMTKEVNEWFSSQLGIGCSLVYMQDTTERRVDPKYAINNDITSFSDAYPILIIGQASLNDLNSRLTNPLPVNRFRPNIVFTGGTPYEEDGMEHFRINHLDFYGVKPSARCVITTTNQETGIAGKEPLKTLATYRSKNNKVYFGQNVLMKGEGKINVGDPIEIVRQNQTSFLSY